MKRIFALVASLATGVALGGLVSQMSPAARTVLTWTSLPRLEEKTSTRAEPAAAKDVSTASESMGDTPEGLIRMPPEARQKLSAINLDPTEVATAAKKESAPNAGASSLREYQIRSLIGGRVIERKVDVGSLVGSQGDPSDLYTVADLAKVWAELAVPTTDLHVIEEGQAVVIASGGDSGKQGDGRIIFISPLVNPDTRSARVIALIDNKLLIWRPGAVVTADIVTKEEPVEVRVPRAALQTIGGEHVVFVRTPNGFQRRTVTIGRSDEQTVEIVWNLSVGEQIVVKNTFLLKAELGKGEAESED
jgi:cobalt-zinc-cadmium efflux system membrane fusion protein